MRSSGGLQNYYNNGNTRNEITNTPDTKTIIQKNYISEKAMSRPLAFLEKVKKMKSKTSASDTEDTSSSFPSGPTYTYNPLAVRPLPYQSTESLSSNNNLEFNIL